MKLNVKKLNVDAIIPTRAYSTDSGLDLYACLSENVIIPAVSAYETTKTFHENWDGGHYSIREDIETMPVPASAMIPTGIAIELPEPRYATFSESHRVQLDHEDSFLYDSKELIVYEGQIRPRSGLAAKHSVSCHFGTIDSSYVGELKVIMYNFGTKPFTVTHGMKIAQLVITPIVIPTVEEVETIGNSARGANGFGSTGI